jgi:hypothetical protein
MDLLHRTQAHGAPGRITFYKLRGAKTESIARDHG